MSIYFTIAQYDVASAKSLLEAIKPPLKIEEGVEIDLILMLNIPIVLSVGEHVVHIVFGRPPTKAKTSKKACEALI